MFIHDSIIIEYDIKSKYPEEYSTIDKEAKGQFIIYEDDRVGKKIIAFLFLSKAHPKGILFFRSPFSIWGQIFQSPFKLERIPCEHHSMFIYD